MEYEKIQQLIKDMENSKLSSFDIEFPDGTKISMKKENKQLIIQNNPTEETKQEVVTISDEQIYQEESKVKANNVKGNIVKSPMVGTFYTKPSPTSKPYVEIGAEVKKGDTLCIIEAMKLMNEIESEFSGKITQVLLKDGDAVEYGAPLFVIE